MPAPVPEPLDREAIQLLAEIGLIGAQAGQAAAARALFGALQILRPESTVPYIGRALAEQGVNAPLEAARILRDEALVRHPGDAELCVFLAVALQDAGERAEAQRVLRRVVNHGAADDDAHVQIARKLLDADRAGDPARSAALQFC
jgi:hypothetical protein